jgi:hypothetical protein
MKRLLWVVPVLVVGSASAWAQQEQQARQAAAVAQQMEIRFSRIDGRPQTYYATMATTMKRQLNLTDEQAAKITAKIDDLNAKLESTQADLFGVGTTRIPQGDGAKKAIAELNGLVRDNAVSVDKDLTEEQSTAWETSSFQSLITLRNSGLQLTADQNSKLQVLVSETGKQLAKATDGKAYGEIQEKAIRKYANDILTDEQFDQLTQGAMSYMARQTAPKPARPADAVKDLP